MVAARERRRQRGKGPEIVEAETAEHAIVRVAGTLPLAEQAGVYEAWPVDQPGASLRITLAARRGRP